MILFENFKNIEDTCKEYGIENYTINNDGSIGVDGNVDLYNKGLIKLPLKFNIVSGHFNCGRNKLTSLEGCPIKVGSHFWCYNNQLTSLEGCPKEVDGNFFCYNNKLTSLEGCPNEVGGAFNCKYNKLTSLEGCTRRINGSFYCSANQLTSLKGGPEYVSGYYYCTDNNIYSIEGVPQVIERDFGCNGNPIHSIYKLFGNYKSFFNSLDYNYLRGDKIDKIRFKLALKEIGKRLPNKLHSYYSYICY